MPEIEALRSRLSDGVVELRPIAEWDIPEILIAHQDDKRMHKRLGAKKPPSGAQLGRQVEQADENRRAGRQISLTIVEPGKDWCRGRVDVHEIDWAEGSAQLGIWVAKRYRGREFGRRALALASQWLFSDAKLRRLEIHTAADNVEMRRTAAAAGYREIEAGDQVVLVLSAETSS